MGRGSQPGMTGRAPARRYGRSTLLLLLNVLAAGLLLAVSSGSAIAHPADDDQSLTVPSTAGSTVARSWTGSVPTQANPTSDCAAFPTSDDHRFAITVPAAVGTTLDATFNFRISWTPTSGGSATSDLILTVVGPDPSPGNGLVDGPEVGSSDGGSPAERVTATNLASGLYHALVCGFANTAPQPYSGSLTVTTKSRTTETSLPSTGAQGLEFSASVPADQQRDEAEPLIEIDRNGLLYTCGPTGFSNAADYAQVSTDGGDQFHLLGTPPRGQQGGGGGGDCGMATGLTRNPFGVFQYAYTGLGPLTGFTTATSPNDGRNLGTAGPDENGLPGVVPGPVEPGFLADRQWQVFIDPAKNPTACAGAATAPRETRGCVLLSYNRLTPRNTVVQHSVNGGFTYSTTVRSAAQDTDFPGPLRYDAPRNLVYFPWSHTGADGEQEVRLSTSKDGGLTWTNCLAAVAPGDIPPFVIADHDTAGNIYVVYSEKQRYHAYLVSLHAADVAKCNLPVANVSRVNPGFSKPAQVDRNTIRTAVFPWIAAGGGVGRIAVSFYGTTTDGDPAFGCRPTNPPATRGFCAAWNVYVNQSLNALGTTPAFSQIKATTHPFHYDSICLSGLACDLSVPPGDRTLADFFSIAYNRVSKRLAVVFNRAEKKPNEDFGHVANPMAFVQIAGPKNGGGFVGKNPDRAALRTSAFDPAGDALSNYSILQPGPPTVVPGVPPTENERSADFISAVVGPERNLTTGALITNGGFNVSMRILNLRPTALLNTRLRTGSQSQLWIFRFVNGYQAAAAVASYNPAFDTDPNDGNPAEGFRFGFNNYTTGAAPCVGTPVSLGEKCVVYPGATPIPGQVTVDPVTGIGRIRMRVPRNLLKALGPADAFGRPTLVSAANGSRFYDATAFSLGNTLSPTQDVQSFLYPFDNTRAFDFTLGSGTVTNPPPPLDPVVVLTKTGPATAQRSATVPFSLTYLNGGPDAASNAKIVDTIPLGLTFVSASGGLRRSYDSATRKVTWNVGAVPANGRGTVYVTVKVASTAGIGSSIVNHADFIADATVSPPTAAWNLTVVP
jgi:uncharacterized repeat protein (TIGR01451 family)